MAAGVEKNPILYFPKNCPGLHIADDNNEFESIVTTPRLLLGWCLDAYTIIVAGAVEESFDSKRLDEIEDENAVLFTNVRRYTEDLRVAIVGKIHPQKKSLNLHSLNSLEPWVDISVVYSNERSGLLPHIHRFSLGGEDNNLQVSADKFLNTIVMYTIPDPVCHEFLSSSPIHVIPELNSFGSIDLSIGTRKRTRRASITSSFSIPASHRFRLILRLLNSSSFIYSVVKHHLPISSRQSLLPKKYWRKTVIFMIRLVVFPILIIMGCLRVLAGAVNSVIDFLNINKIVHNQPDNSSQSTVSPQPSIISSSVSERVESSTHYPSLFSISCFARQLRYKIQEFSRWPFYLQRVQQIRNGVRKMISWPISDVAFEDGSGDSSMVFGGQEMLFLEASSLSDCTWRFVLDLAVGVFVFSLLHSNGAVEARKFTALLFQLFHQLDNDVLRSWVKWLLEFPAGLKLNLFLGRRLGGVILFIIDAWKGELERIATFLVLDKNNNAIFELTVSMVLVLSGLGLCGASLVIAAALDILSLLTLHIELLRRTFAFFHRQFISVLGTLFLLIRGKKRNVLRNRIDSVGYGDSPPEALAHLMLGVFLFAITFFLFPTAAVYYSFLTLICLCLAVIRTFLLALLTFLNNVPLYAPLCALFFPKRVPVGIDLQLFKQDGSFHERKAVSTLDICAQYVQGTPLSDYLDQVDEESRDIKSNSSSRVDLWFNLESKAASPLTLFAAPFISALRRFFKYHLQPAQLFNAIVLGHSLPLGNSIPTCEGPIGRTISDYWKTLLGSIDFAIYNLC
jgi:hypothetical protein